MIEQEMPSNPANRKSMTLKTGSFLLTFFMMLFFLPDMQAQNSTSSPFTIFGIGEIETRDFGRTTGMGSVGIGFQSDNFLNRLNPAGLSGIDTLRFILDVSAAVKFSEFRTSAQKERTNDFNFRDLAVGVRLSKRWTSSVGLSPYSNVGYRLSVQQTVQGTTNYSPVNTSFSGSGGVNKFYWANAYEVFRGFSLGVTSSYIFGNITHHEDLDVLTIVDTYNINKIYFDFGMLYSHWFGQYTNISVGGVYGYESKMSIQRTQMITSNTAVERNQRQPDLKTYLPEFYGAGFSILRNKKAAEWVFAADYQYRKWSADPSRHKGLAYTDSRIYRAGLQLTPDKRRPEKYIRAMRFQLGACYNQSYLTVNGYQMDDYSISAGAAFPFRNMSYVNVAVNVGESRTGQRGGITERYVLLSVNLSLIERWFAKQQWD
jgi:hypothetical protein